MRRGSALPAGLALFAALLAGCREAAPPSPRPAREGVRLSEENPDANAPAIADFFRRTCLESSSDDAAFASALDASGWEVERTGTASAANPLSMWHTDKGRIFYSRVEIGTMGPVIDCHVELDGPVAPGPERMNAALRPLLGHPSVRPVQGRAQELGWQWSPGAGEQRVLTIAALPASQGPDQAGARRGIAIHLSTTPALAQPSQPGNENVQQDPDR